MLYLFRQDTTFVEVKSRVRIGRGLQCELMLPSSRASREHAEVVLEGDDFFLSDLGSSSGIFMQKQKVRPRHRIGHGERYFLGTESVDAQLRETPLSTELTRALEAEVVAAPGDSACRQVWVDALIERGDPLGSWLADASGRPPPIHSGPDSSVRLTWEAGLVRSAEVSDPRCAHELLRSRLTSHLLELIVDARVWSADAQVAFIEQLAHTQLAALHQLRLQGFPELPQILPHAPRVKRIES